MEFYSFFSKKKSEINDQLIPNFDYDAYAFDFEREELYNRINLRVNQRIDCGLVDEVKGLVNSGITKNNQSMQGIGYKEILEYIRRLAEGDKKKILTNRLIMDSIENNIRKAIQIMIDLASDIVSKNKLRSL